jgi:hypothetical protein
MTDSHEDESDDAGAHLDILVHCVRNTYCPLPDLHAADGVASL